MYIFALVRYLLLLFLSLFCLSSYGQDPLTPPPGAGEPMRLVSSSSARGINQKIFRAYNAVYEHKGSQLAADSGDYYKDDIGNEYFKAIGNVVITQPSGTVIYSNRLDYSASSQQAVLTGNVRMIDGETTLTTNYLTYNTGKQTGTYTGGGRIVGKGDTITSKNAYYFERTKDAYFRNKVIVRTPSAVIYTDTLQYNTMYRDAFFFGPTNINGRKGEKLYTEKGSYNTAFGIAKFNKNNLYTEGSRFLKGDSLFYDRDKGIGEAFRNVLFIDTLDKFYASGEFGRYLESDQSIMLHTRPLIKYVVQQDSSNNDSTATDSTLVKPLTKKEQRKLEKEQEKVQKEQEKQAEKERKELSNQGIKQVATAPPDSVLSPPVKDNIKVDTAYMTADTIFSKVILVKDYKPLDLKLSRDGGTLETSEEVDYGDIDEVDIISTGDSTKLDSTSLKTPQLNPVKKQAPKQEKPKVTAPEKKTPPKPLDAKQIQINTKADSVLRRNAVMPTGKEQDSIMKKAIVAAQSADTTIKDSTVLYSDTARTRIVRAYYNVRVYKSDLQAVSDSVYYGMVDSMFRFMGKPMIWSDGSQISSDTIYMQIKNNKMDNALLKDNAFMVNAVADTVKFNQLKGRKITAFFSNNNIDRIYVDGNAENLVFTTFDKTNRIKEMFHDRSSRIKIKMEGKQIIDYHSIHKVDQKIYPFKFITQENEVLPGFIWKPEDRPKSVEDMMNRKRSKSPTIPDADGDGKPDLPSEKGTSSKPTEKKEVPVEKGKEDSTKKIEKPLTPIKEAPAVDTLQKKVNPVLRPLKEIEKTGN